MMDPTSEMKVNWFAVTPAAAGVADRGGRDRLRSRFRTYRKVDAKNAAQGRERCSEASIIRESNVMDFDEGVKRTGGVRGGNDRRN
jgi:hypothetical protein